MNHRHTPTFTKSFSTSTALTSVFSSTPNSEQYVYGVLFLLRGDTLTDKKIYSQSSEWRKLKTALRSSHPTHKIIALLLYLLKKHTGFTPPLRWTLSILWLLGPSRSWFAYLLHSSERNTLLTATHVLGQDFHHLPKQKKSFVLDIGSGLGHLAQNFSKVKHVSWVCVDKNFFSLFLAQHYHARKDVLYVCMDIEMSNVFRPNTFSTVMCLDCFAWIYEKNDFLKKMYTLLKNNGSLHIVNVHEESAKTLLWGYGVSYRTLKSMLSAIQFRAIHPRSNTTLPANTTDKGKNIDSLGYSVSATK